MGEICCSGGDVDGQEVGGLVLLHRVAAMMREGA
jgi:hypothetical protein